MDFANHVEGTIMCIERSVAGVMFICGKEKDERGTVGGWVKAPNEREAMGYMRGG